MTDPPDYTSHLLHLFNEGDDDARNALLAHARKRLRRLARKMLKGYPGVRRWDETDDVLQHATIRLNRALSDVALDSPQHFWNLAAQQIRRSLIDLARHYLGPEGQGANHHTDSRGQAADDSGGCLQLQADAPADEPQSLEEWAEFHEQVERLPEEERKVVELLWYGAMTQQEVAQVLGMSLRTVKRRWLSARRRLSAALRRGIDNPE
jgi:RNA polymerase sigma-70 factor (ECF subfamily)